ncbi:MGMT family protein [Aspergillus undulatus]|uniref:MGMT family protein n=1 Tax=Aspergillus undulatus TaxID=1810928 RepID=UPI003CCDB011
MPAQVPEPDLGHSFGPHPSDHGVEDHPDSASGHSPQQLHKEPDHDLTNPADTTSGFSSQSQDPHHAQAVSAQEQTMKMEPKIKMPTQNNKLHLKEKETSSESELKLKLTKKIKSHPTLTPLRKRTYITLLSVPPGQWTTYAALAKHLGSSARAVGTAMRLNPFAPGVPCHRVLGADGGLGGFMGSRPLKSGSMEGKGKCGLAGNLGRKRAMLEGEGLTFDERGRARGRVFVDFPE